MEQYSMALDQGEPIALRQAERQLEQLLLQIQEAIEEDPFLALGNPEDEDEDEMDGGENDDA